MSSVLLVSLEGQTISDDFDNDLRDANRWNAPEVNEGNGQLLEQNQRLEFTATASPENSIVQNIKSYPSYNQFWQVQMVVAMDEANFSTVGQDGSISLEIGNTSEGDESAAIGYGAGVLEGETEKEAIFSDGYDDAHPDGIENLDVQDLPPAIGIRVSYDPTSRTLRAYYDLDADQTDGEWTLFETYTIDGSTLTGAQTLDWEMSATDQFWIEINGHSDNAAIPAGSGWADDFECILGRTVHQASIADDFMNNVRDPAKWDAPVVNEGNGQLLEQGERLEFSATASEENDVSQQLLIAPGYNQAWQVQMVASMDEANFSVVDQDGTVTIGVGTTAAGENYVDAGYAAGVLTGTTEKQAILAEGGDDANPDGITTLELGGLPEAIGVRLTYDPNTRLIRAYSNLDPHLEDSAWILIEAYTIDGSVVVGAQSLDWGMTTADQFFFEIIGHSSNAAIAGGSAWADDFEFHLGTSAVGETGLRFLDDFNDDYAEGPADGSWEAPSVNSGSPSFVDANQRREFMITSGAGEQELVQMVHQQYWPRYDQAFEVKVEAHCLPGGLNAEGQVVATELLVENGAGSGDVLLSVAALFDGGSVEQALAVSNSEVIPANEDSDLIVFGALPEVVGIRITWDPETEVLSCYYDTDGDQAVETWVLFADYTLDGSEPGTADESFKSNWSMSAADRFQIGISGGGEGVTVVSGEAHFDNFQLFNTPLPTGYEQWAEGIPIEAMRGATDDASGNGIENLLQYMYGLEPLSTDIDVQLRISMEGGSPVLVHGFNQTATDYVFDYQENPTLDEASWSSGISGSIQEFEVDGAAFRKITLPINPSGTFFRLEVQSLE